MLEAVRRLLSVETPPRRILAMHRLASFSEADRQTAQDIVLMKSAYSGSTVGQYTPRRSLRARVARAPLAADVQHALLGMLHAVHPLLAAVDVKVRLSRAGTVRAVPPEDVHHAVQGVRLAVHCRPAALDAEVGLLRAGVVRAAALAEHVHHTFLGMLRAVLRRLALKVKVRSRLARAMRTRFAQNINHTILGMLPAVHRSLTALYIKIRPPCAGLMCATPNARLRPAPRRCLGRQRRGRWAQQGCVDLSRAHLPFVSHTSIVTRA